MFSCVLAGLEHFLSIPSAGTPRELLRRTELFMFNTHWLSVSKKSLTLAALGLALAGCGQQESTVLTPWGNTANNGTCPTGTTFVTGYGCMYTGSTGSYLTANPCTSRHVSSTQVELACYVAPAYYSSGSVPNYPYLANASSTQEAWIGPEVKVGDQVTLIGSLRVGSAYFGSLFGDCKDERDASSILNGAVGLSMFSLPLGSPATVTSAGTLRFGVSERNSCYEAGSLYVRILRNL
jgi:hypothetical protein